MKTKTPIKTDKKKNDTGADDYEAQEKRIKKMLGNAEAPVSDRTLKKYLKFLESRLELPIVTKGMDYYQGNTYTLLDIDYDHEDEAYGLMSTVKPIKVNYSGGNNVPLCDLECVDKISKNYQFLDDYSVWFVNNR